MIFGFKKYIFAGVIFLIISSAFFIEHRQVLSLKDNNHLLNLRNDELAKELLTAKSKISSYEIAVIKQAEALKKSERERAARVAQLNAQIDTLRNQKPPKECKEAIDWSIEQKGDLAW